MMYYNIKSLETENGENVKKNTDKSQKQNQFPAENTDKSQTKSISS